MDKNILYKYFRKTSSLLENKQIKAWIDSDPDNRDIIIEERRIFDAILLNNIEDSIQASSSDIKLKQRKKYSIFRNVAKAAAVALMLISASVGILATYNFIEQRNHNLQTIAIQSIEVPTGQYLNLKLTDGTLVWLNANTKLGIPANYGVAKRVVTVDGQAYFKVASNKELPFIVKTEKGNVEALGTEFDVMSYSQYAGFEVILLEGKVKVETDEYIAESSIILEQGQKVVMNDEGLIVRMVDDFSSSSWKEGLITFQNKKISEIICVLERIYKIRIEVKDVEIANRVYTGKFRTTDGIDYALNILQKDMNFEILKDESKSIIHINSGR